ncbi:hypothetical protein HWV62_27848 [Athelia sp. TMB]|nr:hypothetical protein HWV62_27848 [Athelia sp. TMB]
MQWPIETFVSMDSVEVCHSSNIPTLNVLPAQAISQQKSFLPEHPFNKEATMSSSSDEEISSESGASSEMVDILNADVLMKGLPVPLFFKEHTRDSVMDYGAAQVQRLKHKAMMAQDEFRMSVVQAHSRLVKAEHFRQDYFNAVAALNYFQIAFNDCDLSTTSEDRDDTIPVKPPKECDNNVERLYQSDLPGLVRKLPDAEAFMKRATKVKGKSRYSFFEASIPFMMNGHGAGIPVTTAG